MKPALLPPAPPKTLLCTWLVSPDKHTPPKRIIVFPAFYSAIVRHKYSGSHSLHAYFLTMKYHILPQWTTAQLNWYLLLTESEDSGRQLIYFWNNVLKQQYNFDCRFSFKWRSPSSSIISVLSVWRCNEFSYEAITAC